MLHPFCHTASRKRIRRISPFKKYIRNIALSCSEAPKKENFKN